MSSKKKIYNISWEYQEPFFLLNLKNLVDYEFSCLPRNLDEEISKNTNIDITNDITNENDDILIVSDYV